MEHEMKLSSNTLRKLRAERGWPQEQLAKASGISLRTIQRVESEGVTSMNTAVSLAATFNVSVLDLQESNGETERYNFVKRYSLLVIGFIVLSFVAISESGRMAGPQSDYFAMANIIGLIVGLAAIAPPLYLSIRHREFIPAGLISIGTPLITLMLASLVYWIVNGKSPSMIMYIIGVAGGAFMYLAFKELNSDNV